MDIEMDWAVRTSTCYRQAERKNHHPDEEDDEQLVYIENVCAKLADADTLV